MCPDDRAVSSLCNCPEMMTLKTMILPGLGSRASNKLSRRFYFTITVKALVLLVESYAKQAPTTKLLLVESFVLVSQFSVYLTMG